MGQQTINQSFKIKSGRVDSVEGLLPVAGAMIYDESLELVLVGDGYKWVAISANTGNNASLSLKTLVPIVQPLLKGVPTTPIPFADAITDQVGTTITATLPDTVTISADMTVDYQALYDIVGNVKNCILIARTLINGSPVGERVIEVPDLNPILFISSERYTVTNPAVLTVEFEADKDITLTMSSHRMGWAQV